MSLICDYLLDFMTLFPGHTFVIHFLLIKICVTRQILSFKDFIAISCPFFIYFSLKFLYILISMEVYLYLF